MHLISFGKLRSRAAVLAATGTLFSVLTTISCHSQAVPRGLPNFGKVTERLYRGAQPSSDGFRALQRMGVTIVVNFRNDEEAAREKRTVEALGMEYVAIPWSGSENPSTSQVMQFLNLVRGSQQGKIFVHCQRGADRTGTMIAAYRIVIEHAPASTAVAEMLQYHYAHFWLPQLERYVISLPHLIQTDAQFSAYAPNLSATPMSEIATILPVTTPQ
jgi:protein tyrosine phosphatase (PTP) superfamily phosphohydrolase (DUF442 family)